MGARRHKSGGSAYTNVGSDYGEEDREITDDWLAAVARALRPGGSLQVFCAQKQWQRFRDVAENNACGLRVRSPWYWCKTNPVPTPRQNFCSAVENGWWFYKPGGKPTWHGGATQKTWFEGAADPATFASGRRTHPMQKPEWLLDEFMRLWTNPGDVVLDLFAGSGTTSVCAIRAGCQFVAVEKDATHCEAARRRIAKAQRAYQQGFDFGEAETS
jgi:DNA modification methylase